MCTPSRRLGKKKRTQGQIGQGIESRARNQTVRTGQGVESRMTDTAGEGGWTGIKGG